MATTKELIDDLRSMGDNTTRDDYRATGTYTEHEWRKHFDTFGEFKAASFTTNVQNTQPETNEYVGNTWNITLPKTTIHTLEELLEYCKVDLTTWQVERFIINKWELGAKDNDGNVQVTPLFQVKATLSKRVEIVNIRAEIESLKAEAKTWAPLPMPIYSSPADSGNMLELLIPDLHAGKLSWSKETGYQDYDTKIAVETFNRALESLIAKACLFSLDHIVLCIGNDLLNSDNFNSMTTKGTLVNTDTRYQRTYKEVRQMMVNAIERLRQIAPVTVKMVPGNHDCQSVFTMGDSLECFFSKYTDVFVDNAPTPHKWFQWGSSLVTWTHGDKGKQSDYGLWLATTLPKQFGETKFREIHVGHRHKLSVDEKYGIRVRTFSALCPPDSWHAANHYTSNWRSAEGIIWNLEQGIIAHVVHNEVD